MSADPLDVSALETLIKNEDTLNIGLQYSPLKDILLELANRVDIAIKQSTKVSKIESGMSTEEMQQFNRKILDLSNKIEKNESEYTEEIKELKSYFSYQLKDNNEKHTKAINSLMEMFSSEEFSKPKVEKIEEEPAPQENNALAEDVATLQKRFDTFLVQYNQQYANIKQIIQNDHSSSMDVLTPIKTSTVDSPVTPLSPAMTPHREKSQIIEIPSKLEIETHEEEKEEIPPPTEHVEEFHSEVVPNMLQTMVNDLMIQVQAIQDQKKATSEKMSKVVEKVNAMIGEVENQRHDMIQLKAEVGGYTSEFERLTDKMTNNAVEAEKSAKEITKRQYGIETELLEAKQLSQDALAKFNMQSEARHDYSGDIKESHDELDGYIKTVEESHAAHITHMETDIESLKKLINSLQTEMNSMTTISSSRSRRSKESGRERRNSLEVHSAREKANAENKSSNPPQVDSAREKQVDAESKRPPIPKLPEKVLENISEKTEKMAAVIATKAENYEKETQTDPYNIPVERYSVATPLNVSRPDKIVIHDIVDREPIKDVEVTETAKEPVVSNTEPEEVDKKPEQVIVVSKPKEEVVEYKNEDYGKYGEKEEKDSEPAEVKEEKKVVVNEERNEPSIRIIPEMTIHEIVFEKIATNESIPEYKPPPPITLSVDNGDKESIQKLQEALKELSNRNESEQYNVLKGRITQQQVMIDDLSKRVDSLSVPQQIVKEVIAPTTSLTPETKAVPIVPTTEAAKEELQQNATANRSLYNGNNADVKPNFDSIVFGPDGNTSSGISTAISSNTQTPRTSSERLKDPLSKDSFEESAQPVKSSRSSKSSTKASAKGSSKTSSRKLQQNTLIHVVQAEIKSSEKKPEAKEDQERSKLMDDLVQKIVNTEFEVSQNKELLSKVVEHQKEADSQISRLIKFASQKKQASSTTKTVTSSRGSMSSRKKAKKEESYKPPEVELEKKKKDSVPPSPPMSPVSNKSQEFKEEQKKEQVKEEKKQAEKEKETEEEETVKTEKETVSDENKEVVSEATNETESEQHIQESSENESVELASMHKSSSLTTSIPVFSNSMLDRSESEDYIPQAVSDQLKIFREAIVDLRSRLQVLVRNNKNESVVIPGVESSPSIEMLAQSNQAAFDDAIRALRKRFDGKTKTLETSVYEIRKELYTFMKMYQDDKATAVPQENEKDETPAVQNDQKGITFVKPISVGSTEKNEPVSHSYEPESKVIIEEQEKPRMLQIRQIQTPPPADLSSGETTPVIDKQVKEKVFPSQRSTKSKEETASTIKKRPTLDQLLEVASTNEDGTYELPPETIPNPTDPPAPSVQSECEIPFLGRNIPQPVKEVTVTNATPKQDILETVLPYLVDLRTDLQMKIDTAVERTRVAETNVQNKVDKDYVEKFFRNMRYQITEVVSKMDAIQQQAPERVTKSELRDFADDLYKTLSRETSTPAGAVSYKCLFCGQTRNVISGMITDPNVAESLGEPPQSKVGRSSIIYGSDKTAYKGKTKYGKPAVVSSLDNKLLPPLKSPNEY